MLKVAVIGAGLAGLSAARTLRRRGLSVTVFDRGRKPGGRCATRNEEVTYDYGAPFFTVHDDDFAAEIRALEKNGSARRWHCRQVEAASRGSQEVKTESLFVGNPSMRNIAEGFGDGLEILQSCEIISLSKCADGWRLVNLDGAEVGEYPAVVLAMPPEQARKLLPSKSSIFPTIAAFKSEARWVGMVTFEEPISVPADVVNYHDSAIERIVRQVSSANRDDRCSWVIHSTAEWAEARIKSERPTISIELLSALSGAMGETLPNVVHRDAHRWRLALPSEASGPGAQWDDEMLLGVCGDWCVAPNIEGAYLSGVACAELVSNALTLEPV